MGNLSDSEKIKRAIERVVENKIKTDTRSCLRLYKAVITTPPDGSKCGVRLVGDDTELFLPYNNIIENSTAGSVVWVAVPFDDFRNAIVWATADLNVGGSGNAKERVDVEFGVAGQTKPSDTLAVGGLFFKYVSAE